MTTTTVKTADLIGAARDFEPGTVRVQYQGKFSKFNDLDLSKPYASRPTPTAPQRSGMEF